MRAHLKPRMHSNGMRTVRCSSRLPGGCLHREGCLPRECLPRGMSAQGCVHLPLWTELLTHTCENITFSRFRLRTVITWTDLIHSDLLESILWTSSIVNYGRKGSFTPSDYVAATVTLTSGAFHLDKQIKAAVRQLYCHRYVIAWCEWTLRLTFKVCSHRAITLRSP